MANEYYAATRIEYGKATDGGEVEQTVFEQDEKVTGLPEKVMKDLWDVGSLYVKEKDGDEEQQVTSSTGDVPGQPTPPSMQGENAQDPKPPTGTDANAPGAQPAKATKPATKAPDTGGSST